LIPLAAAVVLVAVLAGLALAVSANDSKGTKEGEILLTPIASLGVLPFTPDAVPPSSPSGPSLSIPPLSVPSVSLPVPATAPPLGSGATAITTLSGATPGLYGGTNELSVCDAKLLVDFLHQNADKAAAWAQSLGLNVGDIGAYVAGLTDVVLRGDTRVTNHGFDSGHATVIPSVLQAGTAVLVDRFGIPRVRCKCGNPLTPAEPVKSQPKYTGDTWPGFDPTRVVVVLQQETVQSFTLVSLTGGAPIQRVPGLDINAPPKTTTTTSSPPTTAATTTTTRPTTTAPPQTVAPTTAAPTTSAQPVDVTPQGRVTASSSYSNQYPPGLAVDGDPTTSWFSAGDAEGPDSVFTWTSASDRLISAVHTTGNGANADAATRRNFGFRSATFDVYNVAGVRVFTADVSLPGTVDPDVDVRPNVRGSRLVITWHGHKDPTCGGFGELTVMAA
jgi:hypothetical protein